MSYFGSYFTKAFMQTFIRYNNPNALTFNHHYKMPVNSKIVILDMP